MYKKKLEEERNNPNLAVIPVAPADALVEAEDSSKQDSNPPSIRIARDNIISMLVEYITQIDVRIFCQVSFCCR